MDNPNTHESPRQPPRLSRRKKLVFSVTTTLLFLSLLEAGLAFVGVEPIHKIRDPFIGFEPGIPLFVREEDLYVTDSRKLSFFNPQSFPFEKSDEAYRIFCLGGSTTFGRPYDYRTAYPNWLRVYLEETEPKRRWEVVNCGGISYASYRLALLSEELANYDPDLFIVYTGHNEFLEERTYGDVREWSSAFRGALRLASHSRIFSAIDRARDRLRPAPTPRTVLSAEVNTVLEHTNGPETYHRDPELERQVISHFEFSLRRIAHIASQSGAAVILVQPASNLRDFSPFKSENSALSVARRQQWKRHFEEGLRLMEADDSENALRAFLKAEKIDGRHAHLLFFMGESLARLERYEQAEEYFRRARDEDICPLRASTRIQATVRQIGAEYQFQVIDYPALLQQQVLAKEGHGIVGLESFLDHVHPQIDAHAGLGRALYAAMHRQGVVRMQEIGPDVERRAEERIGALIETGDHVGALSNLAMTLSWAGKNEEALRLTEGTLRLSPDNPDVLTLRGRLLQKLGRDDEARVLLEKAVKLNPHDSVTFAQLAEAHGAQGDYEKARDCLVRAIKHTPQRAPMAFRANLHVQLGQACFLLGDENAAVREFRKAREIDPHHPAARDWLKQVSDARSEK